MAVTDEDVRQIINACAGCCCKLCSAEVHDRVVRLQAALSLPVSNTGEWQPIETAPKDGTPILGWNSTFGARETKSITYLPGSPGHADGRTDRWWNWEEMHRVTRWHPTHWMPLPEAPL